MRPRSLLAVALVLAVAVGGVAFVTLDGTERTTVRFVDDEDGATLATVSATVSDSWYERYVGLSDTDSLGADEGMLFVHPKEADHGYVMRDMAFPIDMVFVAENGTVTTIHHARLPPEGEDSPVYEGYGKYVLELPHEYTTDHGIEVGDRVEGLNVTDGADGAATTTDDGSESGTDGSTDADTETTTDAATDAEERATVNFTDGDGTLATVSAAVSDTYDERYVGLSDTDSLGADEGMLFVHPDEAEQGYVMREMGFPIDMVFVAANGTITAIHHAEVPPEGENSPVYEGYGKYVVELPYEYTTDHGIEVGDHVEIPEANRNIETATPTTTDT